MLKLDTGLKKVALALKISVPSLLIVPPEAVSSESNCNESHASSTLIVPPVIVQVPPSILAVQPGSGPRR